MVLPGAACTISMDFFDGAFSSQYFFSIFQNIYFI